MRKFVPFVAVALSPCPATGAAPRLTVTVTGPLWLSSAPPNNSIESDPPVTLKLCGNINTAGELTALVELCSRIAFTVAVLG